MARREVRWERMFPDELERAFEACPLVYQTYGLCEPHGPHNAVGLDGLKAHGVACRAAGAGGGIVAPPYWSHVHEVGVYAVWAHQAVGDVARNWLTAEPPWHHFKSVLYHVRAVDAIGFHAAIFLTGHYGPNWEDLKTLLELVQPYVGARLYGLPDFECNTPGWDPGQPGRGGDHAGKVETSLLWAVEPDCVDASRLPGAEDAGPHFAMGHDAAESDRRRGERMVEDEVAWLVAKGRELLEAYESAGPTARLSSFEQVERLWADVVLPQVPEFASMKPAETRGDLPGDSSWAENAKIIEPR